MFGKKIEKSYYRKILKWKNTSKINLFLYNNQELNLMNIL